ncbi:efflux RND transporter periplasmic adaptor subunit [Ottowia testudinis]|uniref:Efflux RND transporter periplasmic adaptor subunit n=1 Tax=Ottowia testudinis TaxID=2816950 RepID=A0A975H745_9BURK|nr:efflux RND transporter periplasmic adaptor subunit [Ottowia testudinis]QTD46652.1 efflux RND transporter periplasmic adaptor subunit [Ottowia testudinis]
MNPTARRWLKIALVLLSLAALTTFGWRGYQSRQAAQQAQSAPAKDPVIELSAIDLATAHVVDLTSGLPISGALKAVNSAIVKARVPGELQGLTVREGDTVTAGQVIARVESTEYADRVRQAQQQADAARAQVDIAQRQVDNNAALVRQGFISKTAADNALASLNSAQANYRAAQAGTEVVRKSLADTVLKAPISGQISQRLAQPGERVSLEARIVEIVDLSRLELEAALSPADSVAVRVGQQALLTIEGVAQPVPATVARINPSAQAGSRSVLIYLSVTEQPGLRQGLFAQGQLATEQQRALAVPLSAVRTDKPLPYVQVVADGRIAHRTVQMGARGEVDGELWVVVQGVADGASVLRGAAGVLREGTQVKLAAPVVPARAAPNGGRQ